MARQKQRTNTAVAYMLTAASMLSGCALDPQITPEPPEPIKLDGYDLQAIFYGTGSAPTLNSGNEQGCTHETPKPIYGGIIGKDINLSLGETKIEFLKPYNQGLVVVGARCAKAGDKAKEIVAMVAAAGELCRQGKSDRIEWSQDLSKKNDRERDWKRIDPDFSRPPLQANLIRFCKAMTDQLAK
jgi:hypothetical protein